MEHGLVNVRIGDDQYEPLIGQIRNDPALLARMWADAEHRLDEEPGKVWSVAVVRDAGRWVPAAWAAAVETVDAGQRVLKCCDNYEHPRWRGHGLHRAAYRHRHTTIVQGAGLPAVTYLFAQPIALHEADGWYRTGVQGVSHEPGIDPHEWWQLRRGPDPCGSIH